MLEITVLIDNEPGPGLAAEHGLSLWLDYRGRKLLLDTGASAKFAENAAALGVPLAEAALLALSHAHYDHTGGLSAFFAQNDHAPVYLRAGAAENCYMRQGLKRRYIGIPHGSLAACGDRLVYASGLYSPAPGVTLLGHTTPGLAAAGRRADMYLSRGPFLRPDDFRHEQSLVLEGPEGLVVCNSCCHAGADLVLREAAAAFPGQHIHALVGGFHLMHSADGQILSLAQRLKAAGVDRLYTGHCTGGHAYGLLQSVLGDRITQFRTGDRILL